MKNADFPWFFGMFYQRVTMRTSFDHLGSRGFPADGSIPQRSRPWAENHGGFPLGWWDNTGIAIILWMDIEISDLPWFTHEKWSKNGHYNTRMDMILW